MAAIVPGAYFIKNIAASTVIELPGGNSADDTPCEAFVQRSYSDGFVPCQIWIVALVGGNLFTIQNANSRTYMSLLNDDSTDGTPVVGRAFDGGMDQQWIIARSADDEAFVIQNQTAGTFVDLLNGEIANGTPIQGWHQNSTTGTTNRPERRSNTSTLRACTECVK